MIVRDKTFSKSEYKGRPTWAVSSVCPCMPCWSAHDCGYTNSQGKHIVKMNCVTNWNLGCPAGGEPSHIFVERGRTCKRCGARRPKKAEQVTA